MIQTNMNLSEENHLTRQCYQIYQEVSDEITNKDSGILYTVIQKILDTEENNDEIFKRICNYYNIKKNADLEDDLELLGDIVGLFLSKPDETN